MTSSQVPSESLELMKKYPPIENHGIIGNMQTCALCDTFGTIDFMCYPNFDSPSIFAKMLDSKKGGHFKIAPAEIKKYSIKQQYLPQTNLLATKFLSKEDVLQVVDFMHVPSKQTDDKCNWLIRKAEAIRGDCLVEIECFPRFNYGLDEHETRIEDDVRNTSQNNNFKREKAVFLSKNFYMELRCFSNTKEKLDYTYKLDSFDSSETPGNLGVKLQIKLKENQKAYFVFGGSNLKEKETNNTKESKILSFLHFESLFFETYNFWQEWISKSVYKGRWREQVHRSALVLKLLTNQATGAIVAAPTFSFPESVGGTRNWDYRYTWIRDSSFTVYAFIRLGFVEEAENYMRYVETILENMKPDGSLDIMYRINGSKITEETELSHLEGYKLSKPVRIGNGAADHLQLDIYGELMDSIYLYNKYGTSVSYDMWLKVVELVNYVCKNYNQPDMSIWEVRNTRQNFLYSKIMCWVAIDRGIRLAEKRNFPCLDRMRWYKTRDELYLEIMEKGYNFEKKHFCQSYENKESLDAALLIMPMVFFIAPTDPRFINTLNKILMNIENGGLRLNDLVYRYDPRIDDGIPGEEGSFSMCTFWLVEALTRAGKYKTKYLDLALNIFEQMLGYANHLSLYSEEIEKSGEMLGNFPQAFTHLALISAAFNLDRVLS